MAEELDIKTMIADYMEKGFLENIIDMFKHDPKLCPLIGDLMADERIRVRLGTSALVETLSKEVCGSLDQSIPGIAALLKSDNPTIRGDAAYLLGIIGRAEALADLIEALKDQNADVREIAREAIEEIEKKRFNHQPVSLSGRKE